MKALPISERVVFQHLPPIYAQKSEQVSFKLVRKVCWIMGKTGICLVPHLLFQHIDELVHSEGGKGCGL